MTPALALTSRGDEPFRVIRHTLPNGLRVWLQPRSDSSSATALLVVRAGARYEQLANNGISHFVEQSAISSLTRRSTNQRNTWQVSQAKAIHPRRKRPR